MSTRIKVEMKPVSTILTRLGVDRNGAVQMFHTKNVLRRIKRYMPFKTGATYKITVFRRCIRKQDKRSIWPFHLYGLW